MLFTHLSLSSTLHSQTTYFTYSCCAHSTYKSNLPYFPEPSGTLLLLTIHSFFSLLLKILQKYLVLSFPVAYLLYSSQSTLLQTTTSSSERKVE